MTQEVFLVAGGDPHSWPDLVMKNDKIIWIGIDRGALYLLQAGIQPQVAIGDFDSLSEMEKSQVKAQISECHSLPKEKDDTDTEAAFLYATEHFPDAQFTLIGATGGRIDHLLANLWLPLDSRFQVFSERIKIQDRQNTITYFTAGTHQIKKEANKKYLAFVCLTPVEALTIYNAKYPLSNARLATAKAFVSNEFVQETVTFSFESGLIAVIQSKDQ